MSNPILHASAVTIMLLSLLAIPHSPVVRAAPVAQTVPGFVIDHHSVAEFDQIPPEYLAAARALRLLFSDRSVGQNINEALDCLAASTWAQSPAACRRHYTDANWNWRTFSQTDWQNGSVPAAIHFTPSPITYNRANWTFEFRQGSWRELTQGFIQSLAPSYLTSKDVLSYQFSYLNVQTGDDIDSPTQGFFANNADRYDIHDLETFWAQHPDKTFILWTTSLARGAGTQVSNDFNQQMRQYAREHNKVLFDVADIEAHTPAGVPCYDNRDGVTYRAVSNGASENYPTDNLNLPAICQDYTTETDGGHLGSVSAGKIQLAKAFWVLMARLAGWQGTSSPTPTPTPLPAMTPTGTPGPTATATPVATATPQGSEAGIHLAPLDGLSTVVRQGWRAAIAMTVHNEQENLMAGVTVRGTWSNGSSGTAECVTNNFGRCTVVSSRMGSNVSSVQFTVNSLIHLSYPYRPSANHNVDGNNGGQLTLAAPLTYSTTGPLTTSARDGSIESFTASSGSPIVLTWTIESVTTTGMVQFLIYRGAADSPDDAELITIPPLSALPGLLGSYTFTDSTTDPSLPATYWLVELQNGQEVGVARALSTPGDTVAPYRLMLPTLIR